MNKKTTVELMYYNRESQDWENATENGKVKTFECREEAERWLETKDEKTFYRGAYKTYTYLKCPHCGEMVPLEKFTNTCECGKEYNNFGQELAPREEWGWETGETANDILDL